MTHSVHTTDFAYDHPEQKFFVTPVDRVIAGYMSEKLFQCLNYLQIWIMPIFLSVFEKYQ